MPIKNPVEWVVGQLGTPAALGTASPEHYWPAKRRATVPAIRPIYLKDIKLALDAGIRDFATSRTDVIFMCFIYPLMGLVLAAVAAQQSLLPLLFPVAAGFALVGPLFAVGLYEMSRRRDITGRMDWLDVFKVLSSPSIWSIIAMGALLIGLFMLWLVAAQIIYNATLGPAPAASVAAFATAVLTTPAGWAMTGIGLGVGLVFAAIVLTISVVTFPLLLDRPVGFAAAIGLSALAVWRNKVTMLTWGLIVAAGLVLGALPFFLGLVVVLPILGHATWHLYRRLIRA